MPVIEVISKPFYLDFFLLDVYVCYTYCIQYITITELACECRRWDKNKKEINRNCWMISANLAQIKSRKEKLFLNMLLVFMKASGFLCSIWYHWMCHPFHYANVSCGSSGNLTTFPLLCLHDHLVSHSRNLLRRRIGSFNRQASSLTNDISPPKSKAGLCFCSLNPLQQPLQPDALHHLWSHTTATGDT